MSHQGRPLKLDLLRRLLATLVLPAPERYRDYLRRLAALPAKGTADVALRAQQLLEHSLLADLRAVVARVGGGGGVHVCNAFVVRRTVFVLLGPLLWLRAGVACLDAGCVRCSQASQGSASLMLPACLRD